HSEEPPALSVEHVVTEEPVGEGIVVRLMLREAPFAIEHVAIAQHAPEDVHTLGGPPVERRELALRASAPQDVTSTLKLDFAILEPNADVGSVDLLLDG